MNTTPSAPRMRLAASLIALLVVTSAFGPVGTVSAQTVSVSQSAPDGTTVAAGDTITLEATIDYTDVNSPAIDVTLPSGWTVVSHSDDGGSYGPPQPAWVWLEGGENGTSGSHTVSYTVEVPNDTAAGDYTVTAEASGVDPNTSETVSDTEDLTVTVETAPSNQAPTADAGADQTVTANDTVQLDATGSSDPDGDALSYAWTVVDDAGTSVSLSGADTATPTFTAPAVDNETTLTFAVAVTDGSGATDTDTADVTVQPESTPNTAPTADAGPNQTVDEEAPVTLDASGSSDPDGAIAGYAWTQTGSGPSVTLSDAGAAQPTFTAPNVSSETTLTFAVEVTDDDGATDTDSVDVTVQPVTAAPEPSVTITQTATTTTTIAPGENVSFEATIEYTDVNSPAIDVTLPSGWSVVSHTDDGGTYGPPEPAWAWLEGDSDGVSGSHTVTYTVQAPGDAAAGDHSIAAEGSGVDPTDESLVSDSTTLLVTVEAPENQPPTAAFSFTPTDPTVGETVTVDASGSSDADGSIASYAWAFGDGDTATGPNATHAYAAAGTYTVELTVTDDDGATATATQTVDVSEPADAGPGSTLVSVTADGGIEASSFNSGAYQIENTGDQPITSVTYDLSTTSLPDMVFDPEGTAGDGAGKGFTPDSGASTVGVVDGTFSDPKNDAGGDDGYNVLTITFDDFDPGESFAFSADNDPTSIKDATLSSQEAGPISGLELSRATVTVDYADGSTQTAQLMGDGSAGGSQAVLDESVTSAPSIAVDGVPLDAGVLDARHGAATVADASQTVTVTGPANADVTLLRVEAELELDDVPEFDGTPGYNIEEYEANHAEVVEYYTATTGSDGTATVPVTLTNSTPEGGFNYFVAAVGDSAMGSNVVVLELDPTAVNQPPSASFTASPSDPVAGASVSFDATASSDPDGSIASYAWDFGDGTTASGATASHTYSAAGTYTVELVVTDDGGAVDSTTQSVTVGEAPNQPPSAAFSVAPTDPVAGESVTFDGGPSSDTDGSIASYVWTVEDGSGPSVLLESDFEEGSLSGAGWSHNAIEASALAGVDNATSNSGTQSAFHAFGEGAIESPTMDASGADSLTIEFWAQEGSDVFSEDPNPGEDLVVEYLAENGTWIEIVVVQAAGGGGDVTTGSLTLTDAAAMHDGLQVRFHQLSATAGDYWHVDDVTVTAAAGSTAAGTGETFEHTFASAGEHTVTLTVTDDDGATDSTTQTVTVTEPVEELTVEEAIASLNPDGDDSLVGTQELQAAIDFWVEDDAVPDTGGELVSTTELQELIDLWVEDEPIDGGGA